MNTDKEKLPQLRVLVTAGAGGIGRVIAESFAQTGARLHICDIADVALDEIKENEYNLNIPRYVDTFEEEEPIDLDEVSRVLKSLDAQMQRTDSEIDKFCKELGISTPF